MGGVLRLVPVSLEERKCQDGKRLDLGTPGSSLLAYLGKGCRKETWVKCFILGCFFFNIAF
jgi:hypothetical protein